MTVNIIGRRYQNISIKYINDPSKYPPPQLLVKLTQSLEVISAT